MMQTEIMDILNSSRKKLGMSCQALAKKSNTSFATVYNALRGKGNVRLDTLNSIAKALGMRLVVEPIYDADKMIEKQARQKAHELAEMAQGNSQLEMQGVDAGTMHKAENMIFHQLMAGSKRNLWDQ